MSDQTPLIPEQRRQQILRLLRTEQVLSYRQITEALGVSQMTARRDVAALAEQGRVRALKGGASAVSRLLEEPRRADKAVTDLSAKSAIARRAAELVTDSMTIYLDAGTTIQAMRPYLEDRHGLTIVSNDLGTTLAFLDHPSVDLISVGGRVDRDNQSMIGRLAALTLSQLSLDIAFLSSSSWDGRRRSDDPRRSKGRCQTCGHRFRHDDGPPVRQRQVRPLCEVPRVPPERTRHHHQRHRAGRPGRRTPRALGVEVVRAEPIANALHGHEQLS